MGRFFVVMKRPLLAVLLLMLLQAAAGGVVIIASIVKSARGGETLDPNEMLNAPLMSITMIIADVLIALACLAIFRRRQYTQSRYVPSTSTAAQNIIGLIGCAFGVVALDLMTELMAIPNLMEDQMMAIISSPWGVAAVAVAAPIGEEMLFRWGIMGHLLHRNVGVNSSIFVSALLFGLIHMNPAQVFFATMMGLLLGILYWKTGNLMLPILLHMANNSVACAQIWLMGDDARTFRITDHIGGNTVAWAVVAVCTLLCFVVMGWYAISRPAQKTGECNGEYTKD